MRMDYITQTVENIGQRIFETEIQDFSLIGWISERGIPVGAVLGAVALLMLFAGAKCRRVLFGIQGLVVGIAGGFTAGWFLGLDGMSLLGVSAAVGIVLCVLEAVFLRFGAFFFAVCTAAGSVVLLVPDPSWIVWAIGGAVGIVFGILTAVFLNPLIIPVTGIAGSVMGGAALTAFIDPSNRIVLYLSCLVLAIVGITVQYIVEYRKIARIERKRAGEIRKKKSVESEVESARSVLDIDEETETQE